MAKPLNDNLKAVRVETDEGDLVPIMDVAGLKFSELVQAVTSHNKAGKLTLKIYIKPSAAGTLAVKAECNITKPKGMLAESLLWPTPEGNLLAESLLWPTPEGNLLAEDPRQTRLDLKPVIQEEPKQLKQVGA